MVHTKGSETARWSQSQKMHPSPDRSLQLDSSKSESLVILDQHARVNAFPGIFLVREILFVIALFAFIFNGLEKSLNDVLFQKQNAFSESPSC